MVTANLLRRPNLEKKLNAGLSLPLTLVSAPAGYGKSVLLSQWVASYGGKIAWVSLDVEDSDLRTFLSYVVAALQTAVPDACKKTQEMLQATSLPPVATLTASLINDLNLIEDPVVLVLDDYHRVNEQKVHELLGSLLEHPPRDFHLQLLTRRDPALPLARLRARAKMIDVRTQDLRFGVTETETFMEKIAGITISGAARDNLQQQLEGWVAGLRLVSLSLDRQSDPNRFLAELSGGLHHIREFFIAEVLSRQPQGIQICLISASILDRFGLDICERLCKADGSDRSGDAKQFIEYLIRGDFFAVSLDADNRWFRYHHWFRHQLREQLNRLYSPEQIQDMHLNASSWFAENGLVDEAIHHALAAGDAERAAELVERHRKEALNNDNWPVLAKRLSMLPIDLIEQRPFLLLTKAWVLFVQRDYATMSPVLEKLSKLIDNKSDPAIQREFSFFEGYFRYFEADAEQALKSYRKAVRKTDSNFPLFKGESELHYSLALHMGGKKEAALKRMRKVIQEKRWPHKVIQGRMWAGISFVQMLEGELDEALSAAQQCIDLGSRDNSLFVKSWGVYLEGLVYLQHMELERAIKSFSQLTENPYVINVRAAVDSYCGLALVYAMMGQADKSNDVLEQLQAFALSKNDPLYLFIISALRARLALLEGDTDGAVRRAASVDVTMDTGVMLWWAEVPRLTEYRILIAQGSKANLKKAMAKLGRYEKENRAVHNIYQTIEVLTLRTLAHVKEGQAERAAATLEQALRMAEPGRFVRPFWEAGAPMVALLKKTKKHSAAGDFVDQLLATCETVGNRQLMDRHDVQRGPRKRGASNGAPERLTVREKEILELLAERLRDKEIAAKLYISTATVKSHLGHIFQKLNVRDRLEAVHKARARKLLPPA